MSSRAVVRALARAGLRPAGPLGAGAGGPRRAVRDADGRGWAVTVVRDGAGRAELRRRVAVLAGLDHPHVARVAPLLELRDGSAVVLQGEVPGPDLLTVCRARGQWSPGEVVTLVVPLAEALDAMHRAGVAHGDVAPGNVVLEPDGRPVLVDLACGAGEGEAGTPGVAAPERAAGATPAADVHALARLGHTLLGDGADWDPAAAALVEVLRRAADPDPDRRPTAAGLAADVFAACAPEPLRMPDAAVLARLTLRRLAGPPDDATVLLAPRDVPRGRHRARRPLRGPVVVLGTGLVLAAVVAGALRLGGVGASAGPSAAAETSAAAEPDAAAASPVASAPAAVPRQAGRPRDPVAAAVRLTTERGHALAAGDRVRLSSVTVPGSVAAAADARLADEVAARGGAGGGVEVRAARLLEPDDGAPGTARVLVAARAWVTTAGRAGTRDGTADGTGDGTTAAAPVAVAPASEVVLVLVRAEGGWRVSAVEPPPAR